jgi:hypothetical protein
LAGTLPLVSCRGNRVVLPTKITHFRLPPNEWLARQNLNLFDSIYLCFRSKKVQFMRSLPGRSKYYWKRWRFFKKKFKTFLKILKRLYLCFTSLLLDRLVVGLLSEIAFRIGRDAAILIQLLNPQTILLRGRGSIAGKIWQERLFNGPLTSIAFPVWRAMPRL